MFGSFAVVVYNLSFLVERIEKVAKQVKRSADRVEEVSDRVLKAARLLGRSSASGSIIPVFWFHGT